MRSWVGAFVLGGACSDEAAPQEVEIEAGAVGESVPEVRRCGEAGSEPTVLPPAVAKGLERIGGTTLRVGDERSIGPLKLRYDPLGEDGEHTGGYLVIDGLTGEGTTRLGATRYREKRFEIADHRVDVRVGEAPRFDITLEVMRARCPAQAVLQQTSRPQSLWLSSEGTSSHVLEPRSERLAVELVGSPERLSLRITEREFMRYVPIDASRNRSFRTLDHVVRFDDLIIEPPATEIAVGSRIHVRATIEGAPAPEPIPERGAPAACGVPSSQPTTLPEPLQRRALVVDDIYLTYDDTATTGPFTLVFSPKPWFDDFGEVSIRGPDGFDLAGFFPEHEVPLGVRHDRSLLRLDAIADDDVRARRLALMCPDEVAFTWLREPTYAWLSTVGHRVVRLHNPSVVLELDPDGTFDAGEDGTPFYRRAITPDAVGDAFGVGDTLVEIIDVTSTNARHEEGKWHTSATMPAVHMQVRLSAM